MTYAVGVCGFGRCGSSMAMAMLSEGGVPVAGVVSPGSYELVGGLEVAWSLDLNGRCVKLLDSVLYYGLPRASGWRFVWLDRDPIQQAISHVKFVKAIGLASTLEADGGDARAVDQFAASYRRDRARAVAGLHAAGRVTKLRYEDVLADPRAAAERLRREVWPTLDVDAAAAAVHDRDGACRPDLAYEATGQH